MRNFNILSLKMITGAFLLCLVILAGTCKKKSPKETMNITTALLGKTWLHSHEDDRGDTLVYRPNNYDFPPSRGRTGFMLETDGTFRQYDIAPTDGLEEHAGQWRMRDEKHMEVTFPKRNATDYDVEIISVEANILKIKRYFKQQ